MNPIQGRTVALSALVQAGSLCLSVAKSGLLASDAVETCRESLFRFDAVTPFDIYNTGDLLAHGKHRLGQMLSQPAESDRELLALGGQILGLARRFKTNDQAQRAVRADLFSALERVQGLQEKAERLSALDHSCAALYQTHISPLARRIIIHGDPALLKRQENADRIRMLLLAGLRAGVLFYQLKGSRWQLLMQRQQIRHQLNFI